MSDEQLKSETGVIGVISPQDVDTDEGTSQEVPLEQREAARVAAFEGAAAAFVDTLPKARAFEVFSVPNKAGFQSDVAELSEREGVKQVVFRFPYGAARVDNLIFMGTDNATRIISLRVGVNEQILQEFPASFFDLRDILEVEALLNREKHPSTEAIMRTLWPAWANSRAITLPVLEPGVQLVLKVSGKWDDIVLKCLTVR